MKKLKEHKKDVILFIIVFLISIVMCGAFLQPHYTHDTYKIVRDGYEFYSYDKFLKESRPFTATITLLADKINLSIESYMIISFVLALIFLSASVVVMYKIFSKKNENNSKLINICIILLSFVTIFNYLAIEHIYFLECCILALGILLSVFAAKIIIDKEKYAYVKSIILIIIAVFCYQGSIAIFPMILLTYKLLFEKNNLKDNFIEIVKLALIYGMAMLLTIIFAKFLMGGSRITVNYTQIDILNIFHWFKELVINSLGVIPPYVNISIIALTCICLLILYKANAKEKIIYIFKYLLVTLTAIAISLAPVILGSGLDLTPRMCISYGTTIGISLLALVYVTSKNNRKYQVITLFIITICVFALNVALYVVLTNQHILTNKMDAERCQDIKQAVEEYEASTGIKVTKLAAVWRGDLDLYYPNMMHAGAITQKALNSWASREAITFYLDREMRFMPFSIEQYVNFFVYEKSEKYTTEPIVIEGDILYYNGSS